MTAYINQEDVENALSAATILALYDDGNGGVNTTAVDAVCQRASDYVDSFVAREYPAPFPMTGTIPAMMKEAALQFGIAFSFMRHPEYVRQYGDTARSDKLFEEAKSMCERIVGAIQVLVELAAPANVGGTVHDGTSDDPGTTSRFFIDGTGDF